MNDARTAQELADDICREVAELPDRSSPEDWPEAMLVTQDELRRIVLSALASQADPLEWEPLPEDEQERRSFDSSVELYGGDVRTAIATNLRLFAAGNPRGSFGHLCRIMANEVAKLYAPAQAEPVALPRSDSEAARAAIEAVFAERNYPCAPTACARAGFEAAVRLSTTPPEEVLQLATDEAVKEAGLNCLDAEVRARIESQSMGGYLNPEAWKGVKS